MKEIWCKIQNWKDSGIIVNDLFKRILNIFKYSKVCNYSCLMPDQTCFFVFDICCIQMNIEERTLKAKYTLHAMQLFQTYNGK